MNKINIGGYLKEKRVDAGLTQIEVAKHLGYNSAQFISNFERGLCTPPLKKLRKIVTLYKISPNEIIDLIIEEQRRCLRKDLMSRAR